MRPYIITALLITGLASCDEPYIIEPQDIDPVFIIEGLLTDQLKQHYIRITQTGDFYSTGATPRVSGAQVMVTDSNGNIFAYVEEEDSIGLYLSQEIFQGEVGVTYHLNVTLGNTTYTASDELMRVTTIDSTVYRIDEDRKAELEKDGDNANEEDVGRYYEVLMYTKEPQETVDYYLFKFYRDGEIVNYDGRDIYYADDVIVQENINGIAANDWYRKGELATYEMYSLTRTAFLYYADLNITINNDGGLFSPLPTNPRTNISNGALGLFQVSAVAVDEVTIE